jgi:hypothetical protein
VAHQILEGIDDDPSPWQGWPRTTWRSSRDVELTSRRRSVPMMVPGIAERAS